MLVLASVLAARAVAARTRARLGGQRAAILGACAGTGIALLANLAVLVPHTLALNPASHPLYMQGQIAGTHLNSVLVGTEIEVLAVALYVQSIAVALRRAMHSPHGNGDVGP